MKLRYLLPLVLFVVMAVFLAIGLNRDPRELPSPLVGKPAPAFRIPEVMAPDRQFSPADMQGKVWILNVWASWCTGCRLEHPVLMDLARMRRVPVIGLDYKDQRRDGLKFLAAHGDPYQLSALDLDGRVGIDWGVYGVPETFVMDRQGVIRHKHVGPLTQEVLRDTILPLVAQLEQSS